MNQPDTAIVRRSVIVEAPIDQAFAVFTGRFGDFKPPEHNILGVPIAETVFEPHVGAPDWNGWEGVRDGGGDDAGWTCTSTATPTSSRPAPDCPPCRSAFDNKSASSNSHRRFRRV